MSAPQRLYTLLRDAFSREHAGPPRLPAWSHAPLLGWLWGLLDRPGSPWALAEERLDLIACNAAAWGVWQHGGGERGLEALSRFGERLDRAHGLEAALAAAEVIGRKLEQTGALPRPLDVRQGRSRLGADNLVALHRRQLSFIVLRLRRAERRLSAADVEALADGLPDEQGEEELSPGPEEVSTLAVWAAGAWFWEEWPRLESPSFVAWISGWFRDAFGGDEAQGGEAGHGGSAESNWRREAELQVRWRAAFCLGLGAALEEDLRAADPAFQGPLPPPDRVAAPLRRRAMGRLLDRFLPAALALLEDRQLALPGLDAEARKGLRRLLMRTPDGRLYRVDSQLARFAGRDNAQREQSLIALLQALGAAVGAKGVA